MTTETTEIIRNVCRVIPGPISEIECQFLYDMAKECRNGAIVEIGSADGTSTTCLGLGSKVGHMLNVYSIDPHVVGMYTPDPTMNDPTSEGTPDKKYYVGQGTGHLRFYDNIKKFGVDDIVIPISDYSEIAFNKGLGREWDIDIGLLFIDGDHRYNYVKRDIQLWAEWVIKGGKILFHDYPFPGVSRSIGELIIGNARYNNFRGVGIDPIVNVSVQV